MFGAIRSRLARLSAPIAAPPEPPASPFPVPVPGPLAADAVLQARSAAFGAACRSHVAAFDQALAGLVAAGSLRPDQQDYARDHRLRFAEALYAIETLLAPEPGWPRCQVLEIGSSITPMLFHAAFPELRLTAACLFRHKQLDGIVERAVQMDLEKLDLRSATALPLPDPPLRDLDMVMLCEVLEHLLVNPANLFRALAGTLRPGGLLYVTTPNFLRQGCRGLILAGRNPQPLFRPEFRPEDRFHHHVREYTMAELLEAMQAAGLVLELAQYSACWDSAEAAATLPADALRNLVVVGRKPRDPAAGA
ncbi:methyltransferase domain-containing protein [Falsiroseomonas sp.]|uniref:class I SAM-dependent methyltransferase n=1 Tax=Falsiroseomonas sp. TaxID=2870721 RepID=UPI00271CF2D2|nr:methyltransferase domain-containing protein [Falsiroseomonas sp.]MDO9498732.1 methyltransferase domain-containing protein [Falsiroseomonas sp.]